MLFKTLSASVYGIDAYLVEVEVDVGSARIQDFNVVGLPDNAVKESRERIKSALRNCGFEFPMARASPSISLPPTYAKKAPPSTSPWDSVWSAAWATFSAKCSTSACFSANFRSTAAFVPCAAPSPPL
jgi:hypothetical protein